MPCPIAIGTIVKVNSAPTQTGTVERNESLGTHCHIIVMNAGPLYTEGQKIAFFGTGGCMKLSPVE